MTSAGNTIRNASDMARLSATYATLARRVTPAVVNINTRQTVPGRVREDPFGGMFGGEPEREAQGWVQA
jgi:S1-C subfamily serine protease